MVRLAKSWMGSSKGMKMAGKKPAEVIRRYPNNPVLAAADVPYPATLVFNAGVARFQGRYVMLFRNDYGDCREPRHPSRGTNLGLATSDDGMHWTVEPEPVWRMQTDEIRRVYDPRLTVLQGRCYVCFATDTAHGIRGGLAVTDDLHRFEILNLSVPDNRNMVLLPERVGGRMARLERPFPIYGRGAPEAFDIWYSESPDGRFWGDSHLVLGAEQVTWANGKIGPAAPPIKTDRGWLTLFHGVNKDESRPLKGWEPYPWTKTYHMGVMLLDLHQPWRVVGMCGEPLMTPEADYELDGYRGSVLFPGGMLAEEDGEVKIYYGAADTVECLATAHVDDLLALCRPA